MLVCTNSSDLFSYYIYGRLGQTSRLSSHRHYEDLWGQSPTQLGRRTSEATALKGKQLSLACKRRPRWPDVRTQVSRGTAESPGEDGAPQLDAGWGGRKERKIVAKRGRHGKKQGAEESRKARGRAREADDPRSVGL